MLRVAIVASLFALFFGAHAFAAKSCRSIHSVRAISFAEKISLSKIEQELISAPSKKHDRSF
jgi:hypothetical protein